MRLMRASAMLPPLCEAARQRWGGGAMLRSADMPAWTWAWTWVCVGAGGGGAVERHRGDDGALRDSDRGGAGDANRGGVGRDRLGHGSHGRGLPGPEGRPALVGQVGAPHVAARGGGRRNRAGAGVPAPVAAQRVPALAQRQLTPECGADGRGARGSVAAPWGGDDAGAAEWCGVRRMWRAGSLMARSCGGGGGTQRCVAKRVAVRAQEMRCRVTMVVVERSVRSEVGVAS